MNERKPTALIADDEPLLRESLERMLAKSWPDLADRRSRTQRSGGDRSVRVALDQISAFSTFTCPVSTGVDAAQHIGRRAHLVFVTAYDQYAVQAFAHGVLDYLVKPVLKERLDETVVRLQERLRASQPVLNTEALLQQLAANLRKTGRAPVFALDSRVRRSDRSDDSGRRRRLPAPRKKSTPSSPGEMKPDSRMKR